MELQLLSFSSLASTFHLPSCLQSHQFQFRVTLSHGIVLLLSFYPRNQSYLSKSKPNKWGDIRGEERRGEESTCACTGTATYDPCACAPVAQCGTFSADVALTLPKERLFDPVFLVRFTDSGLLLEFGMFILFLRCRYSFRALVYGEISVSKWDSWELMAPTSRCCCRSF